MAAEEATHRGGHPSTTREVWPVWIHKAQWWYLSCSWQGMPKVHFVSICHTNVNKGVHDVRDSATGSTEDGFDIDSDIEVSGSDVNSLPRSVYESIAKGRPKT